MCLAWVQSFSKLRKKQQIYETLNIPTPGTLEHSRKHKIYNDTSSSNKLVLLWLPGQPKMQNMPDVLAEHQFIMLENFEAIYISTNGTVSFMSQSFIAGSAILCLFMPNDRSL